MQPMAYLNGTVLWSLISTRQRQLRCRWNQSYSCFFSERWLTTFFAHMTLKMLPLKEIWIVLFVARCQPIAISDVMAVAYSMCDGMPVVLMLNMVPTTDNATVNT